ncbi:MAG: DUF1573 domain-containing protein [Bacteroidetes bacterium]|nr:DUF1573 domain-containing protein [Bacteroidota bacterium]MBU1371118.1 DUF1573 domain-containing protein [Bacteroidota bacterium]MBU1486001.1 DUF1573 domain-containing protein [Bacteroidota bacterium]MBU1762001.1 DUF1573 domain-containing protein [Bacteroidota bacterium]MBU2267601.1 DUF1573 domain-containing protein [Bacteroidota bacterium]
MKKILLICSVIIGFVAFSAMTDNKAEFKFDEETHDFGKVSQGKPVSFVFKFTNVGDEPLIITAVESTCGCTVPSVEPKQGTPIQKGESGSITLTYNAAVAAPFNKFVKITSNSKTPLKMLYIKGEVVAASGK